MNRRSLLKLFLILPGVLPAMDRATPRPPILPDVHYPIEDCKLGINKECTLITQIQESQVAGFQYYKGHEIWRRLKTGDPLSLLREPENNYDRRAVAVFWKKHKLGYISRIDNAAISQMLDKNISLTTQIVRLQETEKPWKRVLFSVYC